MSSGKSAKTPLVYVVDDDKVTSQVLRTVLIRAGFDVATAFCAEEALAGVQEKQPDLMLLDLHLPDRSGLDVCRIVQKDSGANKLPILFVSSNDDVASKVKGFQAGGVDYIPKPFAVEEVIARVSTHLRLRQAYEQLAELQAERIQRLAGAQETIMPLPADLPEAKFSVSLKQINQAGGDFYDVLPVGNKVVDYVVADASGHDLAASFWTAALKTLLGECSSNASSPEMILSAINRALHRILPSGSFFTGVYARVQRQTGRLRVVSAGHPPAVLIFRDGRSPEVTSLEGDVIGAFPDAAFGVAEFKLQDGDRFLLFSDGLIEGVGSWDAGLAELCLACERRRSESLERMVTLITQDLTGRSEVKDDVLLMGVEI